MKRRSGWSGMRTCYPIAASIASCRLASNSPPYARPPTLRPGKPVACGADAAGPAPGRVAGPDLQRVERLPGTQDRAHGQLLHPDRRTLDHDLSRAREYGDRDGGADREPD